MANYNYFGMFICLSFDLEFRLIGLLPAPKLDCLDISNVDPVCAELLKFLFFFIFDRTEIYIIIINLKHNNNSK